MKTPRVTDGVSRRRATRERVNGTAGALAIGLAGLLIQDKFHGLDIDGGWLVTTIVLLCVAVLVTLLTWEPVAARQPLAWKGFGIRSPETAGTDGWSPRPDLELLGAIHRVGLQFRDEGRFDLGESWRANLIQVVRAAYGEAEAAVFVDMLPEPRVPGQFTSRIWFDEHLQPLVAYIHRAQGLNVRRDFDAGSWMPF
jgi:hypothetical protein